LLHVQQAFFLALRVESPMRRAFPARCVWVPADVESVAATSGARSGTAPALGSGRARLSQEQRYGYPFPAGAKPAIASSAVSSAIARERRYAARNYDPLPVVIAHGDGCWLWDEHGRRYLDMMSAYSAVSHGHAHPRIVRALVEQAQRLAVTSRVFHNELLPRFLERVTQLTGLDRALPASGGAESVETALKAARKWGYKVKGIPADRAEVIVCKGNFHGRSITIVGFSSEPQYRDGFGPFPGGFKQVPFGDADALARVTGPHTAAFWSSRFRARRNRRSAGRLSRRVRAHLPRAQRAPDLR
jgi:hypothetical protein